MSCFGLSKSAIAENRCNYATFVLGAILLIIGIINVFILEKLIQSIIVDQISIKRDSQTFKLWSHPPADVYFEIYIMNVTNPEAAAAGREKPNLVNQGPYVFYEIRRKLNVTFHGNGSLSFYEPVFYFWDEKRSKGNKLTDKVTQLDLVVAGLSTQFSSCSTPSKSSFVDCALPFMSKTLLPTVGLFDIPDELFNVQKRSIFKSHTVGDLLFDGYIDPFLNKFRPIAQLSGQSLPKKVGLFYGLNGSAGGLYTMETGENGAERYSQVTHFNRQPILNVWKSDWANRIDGTIGHGFRPFLNEGERVRIFAGDLCRSSELEYNYKSEIDGILTFLYKPPRDAGIPCPIDPKACGFCVPDTGNCPPVGLMDETPCMKEPTFMGKPHFYDSDPLLASAFTGLNPNEHEHETIMHIDPYTGAVIDVDKRLMIYFPVRKSFITKAGNIRLPTNTRDNLTTIFPMFWVNETAKVRPVVFDQIRYMVVPAVMFAKFAPLVILAIASILLIVSTIKIVRWHQQNNQNAECEKQEDKKFESENKQPRKAGKSRSNANPNATTSQKDADVSNPLLKNDPTIAAAASNYC